MILKQYLYKCDFDARLERFIDQSIEIEWHEVKYLIKEYQTFCPLTSLNDVDVYESDAIDSVDLITTKEYNKSKNLVNIPADIDRLFRIYYGFLMSIRYQDDFLMLDRFEEEYFDQLDNYQQKNYEPIIKDDLWDELPLNTLHKMNWELIERIENELLNRIMQNPIKIDEMDAIQILIRFQDNYDPSRDIWDLIDTMKDNLTNLPNLINNLNYYSQELIFCDEDGNPSNKDYKSSIFVDCVLGGI